MARPRTFHYEHCGPPSNPLLVFVMSTSRQRQKVSLTVEFQTPPPKGSCPRWSLTSEYSLPLPRSLLIPTWCSGGIKRCYKFHHKPTYFTVFLYDELALYVEVRPFQPIPRPTSLEQGSLLPLQSLPPRPQTPEFPRGIRDFYTRA